MIKKRLIKGIGLTPTVLGVLLATNGAHGASSTATSTFQVTATVAASCTVSASTLAFGNYNLAQLDQTSTITLTCTNGTSYNIGLDAGTASGATTSARKMTGPSSPTQQYLNYSLYQDSSRSTNWGNVVGSSTLSGTGTGAAVPVTVYGRIPANQTAALGSYADTITVTITYQ